MVFQGYQIPKKNLDARLKNLNLGLRNNALLYANSTLRIRAIDEIKKEADKITVSTQTSADPNALVDLATMTQLSVDELARMRKISDVSYDDSVLREIRRGLENVPKEIIGEPTSGSATSVISDVSEPITAKERAIQSALRSAKNQAQKEGKILTKEEERNIIDNVNKQSNILSSLDLAKPLRSTKRETNKETNEEAKSGVGDETETQSSSYTWTSSEDANFSNMPRDMQDSQLVMEELKKIKNKEDFEKFNKELVGIKFGSLTSKKTGGTFYPIIDDFKKTKFSKLGSNTKPENLTKKIDNAWELFRTSKQQYTEIFDREVKQLYGTGLKGGYIRPYYSDYRANFGNLYLSEKSLKKNNLTIYRPKSKLQVIAKKNISPLLKKMILDIQNTLEFDTDDYNNLEADEKRIIERIIRLEKEMKNYNIKKLIDDDEVKIKKRLEILTAQVNAGNNSALVREEMKHLVKQLLKNNAISQGKYKNLIKSIDALAN